MLARYAGRPQKHQFLSVVSRWYERRVPLDPLIVSEIQKHLAKLHQRSQRVFAKAPLQYPEEFETAIDQFAQAVDVAVHRDIGRARGLLASIDDEPIVDWFDRIAQNVGTIRVQYVGNDPKRPERRYTVKRKMSVARVRSLAERGGWRCGYCGIRVIEPRVLRKAQELLGKADFPSRTTGGSNRDYHGVWLLTALTLDHIEPLCLSGDDSDANLVATCWACNFGKYHFTLEQLGLRPPRKKREVENGWRGLTQWL